MTRTISVGKVMVFSTEDSPTLYVPMMNTGDFNKLQSHIINSLNKSNSNRRHLLS